MKRKFLCSLTALVLFVMAAAVNPLGAATSQSKTHAKKHKKNSTHKTTKKPVKAAPSESLVVPLRMRRSETLPSQGWSGEPDGGPNSLEKEKFENRALPFDTIPMNLTDTAVKDHDDVDSESDRGERGETLHSQWTSIGPTKALYPAILNRTGTPYVTSGRITSLAIEPHCTQRRCRLYVGAAGGGIWRTDNALSNNPKWKFISNSFNTNAIGTIRIDPTDPDGETIYVGTGEPNASNDSGAGQGIYKSTDGGDSWSLLKGSSFAINRSISDIVIDPTNSHTIYVGTTRGIRGVSSTSAVGTGNPPAGTGSPVGLYKSVDGGHSFTLLWDPFPITPGGFTEGITGVALDPSNPAIIYSGAFGLGIFRSSPTEAGGAFQQVFTSLGFDPDPNFEDSFSKTAFALTIKNGHTRIYVGDGGSNGPDFGQEGAEVWRADNANVPAAVLMASQTVPTPGGWKKLTNPVNGTPGYAGYNYCTGQCWYDNGVYSPPGQPDTVFIIGSYVYAEAGGRSNARAVIRSTTAGEPDPANNNRTFTDLTRDASSNTTPNGIHPDQHALVFMPGNPDVWFEGSDGGLMRSSGAYADITSQCAGRPIGAASMLTCKRVLSAVPTLLTSLNTGLNTLQFQSLSINPHNPTGELLGGTQDNGTFLYEGSSVLWPETIFGDGGQSGFNAANPDIRFHTYFGPQVDSNFRGTVTTGWVWIADPLLASREISAFYIPIIADPVPAKGGTIFAGLQGVWRTTDNGGSQAYLEANCSEIGTSTPLPCGDWVELGSATGGTTSASRLTGIARGNRAGGFVVATARATGDTGTLWVATRPGRVFVSKNADAVSATPGADGSSVTFTRIDSLSPNSPGRFVSGIYVDPANSNHAWISYSGYSANTPLQPGHVFDVTYNPVAGTAVWTRLDNTLGDIPLTALVRDDATGDLYAANDFGVLRLAAGSTTWQTAAKGMPKVEVAGLSISNSARVLYAATHGRGAYVLKLSREEDGNGHDGEGHEGN